MKQRMMYITLVLGIVLPVNAAQIPQNPKSEIRNPIVLV